MLNSSKREVLSDLMCRPVDIEVERGPSYHHVGANGPLTRLRFGCYLFVSVLYLCKRRLLHFDF